MNSLYFKMVTFPLFLKDFFASLLGITVVYANSPGGVGGETTLPQFNVGSALHSKLGGPTGKHKPYACKMEQIPLLVIFLCSAPKR